MARLINLSIEGHEQRLFIKNLRFGINTRNRNISPLDLRLITKRALSQTRV